jgi:peptidoglycan/xylan/chitin deacetylase (PgdA/CDA1 family)
MRARAAKAAVVGILLTFPVMAGLLAQDLPEKRIAFTFNDLHARAPLGFWKPRELNMLILRALEADGIKAAGFLVGERIEADTSAFIILEDWISRGHSLGNQTYANVDLNQLSAEDFLLHVKDGQNYLRAASQRIRFDYRYFRFPFQHEGDTRSKKREVRGFLRRNDYRIVPVSVRTTDYLFNRPYLDGFQDTERVAELKEMYLNHIEHCLDYAEGQSEKVFGRSIPHILELHCGVATAHFLEDLIARLKARGYSFVSVQEALADPAYQTEETYTGPLGLSFIDRVAATRDLPFDPDHHRHGYVDTR